MNLDQLPEKRNHPLALWMSARRAALAACGGALIFGAGMPDLRADTAFVLPQGTWGIDVEYKDYFPIDTRYDPDGDKEDIAADYNTSLGSAFLPSLGLVEAGFGLPAGSASLGDSVVDLEYDIKILELRPAYGLTDKLSLGAKIPYWWVRTKVDAEVDSSSTSSATVGLNPLWGTASDPFGSPLVPLALGGTPVTTEDIQQILGPGLSINGQPAVPGFGYGRFETWQGEGLSDIELGARYQYAKSEQWRHAFTGGVRLPTGEVDDPDNLVDFPFGTGAYALLFRSHHDYTGLENWLFNLTLRYDLYLPSEETKRVIDDPNLPLTTNKEKVDIDIGDRFEMDLLAKYNFTPVWSVTARYRYSAKLEDDVDGDLGYNYSALEEETARTEQVYQIYLSYSNLEKFRNKKARIPLEASISYRDRFAGSNNALDSQYLQAALRVYF
jgi:hypothetical protein